MMPFEKTIAGLALLGAVLAVPAPAAAQFGAAPFALGFASDREADDDVFRRPPLYVDGPYVVIRLEDNRLYVMDRARVLWSAPVATGTGFRVQGQDRAWHFATPRGTFRVHRKEKNPVWIMPDWAYIESGQPIPPEGSPARRREGMLGTSAIYIGYELALHGTNHPELVLDPNPDDRRVSHGCIRLTNEAARKLYHSVEVGTPVLIY